MSSAPSSAPAPLPTWLRLALLVGLYSVPLLAVLQPGVDWDLWWHLRVGEWILDNGRVPDHDPFSFYGPSHPWIAYSWLFEVLVYGLFRVFGLYGPLLYAALLSLAVVAALHRLVAKRQPHFLYGLVLLTAVTLTLAMLFKQRPWLFTFLFATLTLDVILDLRDGRPTRLAYVLPFCYILWANVHIPFVYGLALLGLACVAPVLDALRRGGADRLAWTRDPAWKKVVALTVACFLATLVNPYHVRLYGVVLELATQSGPYRWINELRPPEFRSEPSEWFMLGLFGATAFALGRRARLSSFEVLLLAAAAWFSFRAVRDIWFVALAAAALLSSAGPRLVEEGQRFALTPCRIGLLVGAILLAAGLIGVARDLTPTRLQDGVAERFPTGAAAFVNERGYEGRLLNDFNWGGYLIWETRKLKVVVDGRTNIHGDERIQNVASVWVGAPGWENNPDLIDADVVIADRTEPLADLLLNDERFARVYEDGQARVFVRRTGQDGAR